MAAQKLISGLVPPLTVYYDGTCKLCRSEFENIRARDLRGELILIDCSPKDFDAHGLPVSRDVLMNVIHARDAAGKWLSGVDVFIAAYQAADLNWVCVILHHRWVKPYAIGAYPWLVRNRYRIAALGLHRILNFFTHRARWRAHAEAAVVRVNACKSSNGGTCHSGDCSLHVNT
jgi:predicted DCC family thiol-disulfide oxidoreductase YuxK